jgi:hypothetical protein
VNSKTFAAQSALTSLALGALLAACGRERMSLGTNDMEPEPEVALCGDGTIHGDYQIVRQRELDALLGCEVIEGDVLIRQPPDSNEELDLAPLARLREVTGSLTLDRLHSLTGLEALEQVGGLEILKITTEDLTGLSHLQRVLSEFPRNGSTGPINIGGCANLLSLAGLERLNVWSDLNVADNPALQTLADLSGPGAVRQITLTDLPSLHDLHGLELIHDVSRVIVMNTGVVTLDAFKLRNADDLLLIQNPALTRLDGLDQLSSVGTLSVYENDALLSATLPRLQSAQMISITGNDSLIELPGGGGSSGSGYLPPDADPHSETGVSFAIDLYEVGNNARLTRVTSPTLVNNVQQVSIWGNPALSDLTLSHLQRADGLYIVDNSSLTALSAPELERVGDLRVVNNPQLSTSAFENVQTFTRTMSGNAEAMSAP